MRRAARRSAGWASRLGLAGLLAVAWAGCASPDACHEPPDGRAVVQALSGRDASVLLASGEPAVLHLPEAVFVDAGERCAHADPSGMRVGDTLAFHVDQWATSYPMQGWPETVVVLRG